MTIKMKLYIGAVISIFTVILIGFILNYERHQDEEITNKSRIAERLVKDVFEMNILVNDYRMYKGHIRERAFAQWQSKFKSTLKTQAMLESKNSQEQLLLDELRQNLDGINFLFNNLIAIEGKKQENGNANDILLVEMKDKIFAQIMGRSQTVISLSTQFYDMNYETLGAIHNKSHFFIISSILFLTFSIIITSFLIKQGISKPIAGITVWLEILGKGNLDYKMGIEGDNEISRIAKSLEMMAAKLKEITVSRDLLVAEINEREKSQSEQTKISDRLKRLSEAATEAITIVDNGLIVDANEQYTRMLGYGSEEIKGHSAMDFVVPQERARVRDIILSGYEQPYETIGLRKDGTTLDLLICGKTLILEGSNMRITAITDITAFKSKERELIQARDEWEKTFNTITDYLMLLDSDHKITRMNETMARKFGITPEEAIGKICYELVHGLDKPDENCPHNQLLQDGLEHTVEVYEERLNAYFLVTVTPLRNSNGTLYGSVHIMRDITKLKNSEIDLTAKTYVLERLNKNLETIVNDKVNEIRQKELLLIQQSKMAAMGEMMAAVAHQWRQPLNSLGLLIQDIRDAYQYKELDDAYIDKTVKNSMAQINFMSKTMNDFKDFFKPSSEKETFDMIEIAANVFSLISHQLKINTINYRITCHVHGASFGHYSEVIPCDATSVTAYKNYLSHVILNIITNSRDAIIELKQKGLMDAAEEGMIRVDVFRDNGSLRMEISDNGGGIPNDVIDRIFDPYFTTKEGEKGTGIGLYMSKMIVEESLGGKISARNTDAGAVFTIELNNVSGILSGAETSSTGRSG
ncbi:MAG: PAS domain-containing protein [Nitrospirae bacterium]|nr:PAS domain-containing protein [Nitrospirota bacterium]